jgi:ATP-dependent DNA helicase RecQ
MKEVCFMSMQLVISGSAASSAPLSLDVSGYHLELSGLAEGRKLTVAEDGGRIAVSIDAVDNAPVPEQARQQEEQPSAQAVEQAAVPVQGAPVDGAAVREAGEAAVPAAQPDAVAEQEQLFQRLVSLRKQVAAEVRLPPYIIFHDATLREMCRVLPSDMDTLKDIRGVGQAKLEKYGMRFLQAIREYSAGKAAA